VAGLLGLLVLVLAAGASVATGGRDSLVVRAALGPLPTPTAIPTATSIPTPTPVPTATPVPGPRLDELYGAWTGVSSTEDNSAATPANQLKILVSAASDRSLAMAPVDKPTDVLRFDLERTEGQTLIGTASQGSEVADATLAVTANRREMTITLRPRAGSSSAGKVLTLVLRRD
jgi:hypothetical protein